MKELKLRLYEGEPDTLGNDENREITLEFVGAESFITMIFGGRDGSAKDCITLEEIKSIFERLS